MKTRIPVLALVASVYTGFALAQNVPTDAEWEYVARGSQQNPYYNYAWGGVYRPDQSERAGIEQSVPRRPGPWQCNAGWPDTPPYAPAASP